MWSWRHGCFLDGFHTNPSDIVASTATVTIPGLPAGYGYRSVYSIPG